MKSRSRFASITALALTVAVLSVPLSAFPRQRARDRDRDQPPIVRIIKKVAKFFGIQPNEDFPMPPKP